MLLVFNRWLKKENKEYKPLKHTFTKRIEDKTDDNNNNNNNNIFLNH